MSKPTGIQKKQPIAPKCRTLFRPRTRPADHASSSPRTEPMPDAELQSSSALVVTPTLESIPGLVGTPAEPDSQGTATTGDDGSDTEEEDNTALEEHYLNKNEEYQRRVETVLGDGLRVWKSMGGTWYTCIEGEVIEGHAVLPAARKQRPQTKTSASSSFKASFSADGHESSAVHTAVEQSTVIDQFKFDDQPNAFEQSVPFEQSDAFRYSNVFRQQAKMFEQPTTVDPSEIFPQPTTFKRVKARPSPTKPIPRTFATKVTKSAKPSTHTPAPALVTTLAHRTRDATHLSTVLHHGSAAIDPLGAHARPVPNKVAPPSLAALALEDAIVAHQQASLAQHRGIDAPSTLVLGGTDTSQHAGDPATDEYPLTAPGVYSAPPRSAIAHLAHGGSPATSSATGPASPSTSHDSPAAPTASPRRIASGSFGTFEGSPGRFDERKYRLFPTGVAATNHTVDIAITDASFSSAGSSAGSFSSSPAKANRVAWLRGREG
ncbi:hypothetical protein G6514_006940 [Epicoccum nigrum]|nr:hypothetical protein G6514_006940 [Epicoccum nigrum]